ncbi:DUF3561 family protein [Dickeya oryzae]
MQSVTPLPDSSTQTCSSAQTYGSSQSYSSSQTYNSTQTFQGEEDVPPGASYSPLMGALAGFCFYWLAFSLPFVFYGLNSTLLLMLYTWPFFLALMPLSVLIGMLFRVLLPNHVGWMMLCCAVSIPGVFWLVFVLITGW